jgi:hypothetical protein
MRKQTLGFIALSSLAAVGIGYMPACTTEYVDQGTPVPEDAETPAADTGMPMKPKDAGKDTGKPIDTVDASMDVVQPPVDGGRDGAVATDGGDGGSDAGSSSGPAPGSACPTPGVIFTRKCGSCGTQDALCEDNKTVSVYSTCAGEPPMACRPGMTQNSACGLCGTKTEICQSNCQWASGACTGEPMGACSPGSVKYITASCMTPNTFRKQTCGTNCMYGMTEPPPCKARDTFVAVTKTVGGISNFSGELSPLTDKKERPDNGPCPTTGSGSMTTYAFVEVRNTDTVPHKVEIYFDAPVGGTDLDTVVAAYPGTVIPPANTTACVGTVNDICSTSPCTSSWSGLVGANGPTVPAGGSIIIGHWAYFSSDTGKFEMFVKTVN